MSDFAIRAEGLGKQYVIGEREDRFPTLRDQVAQALISPLRRVGAVLKGRSTITSSEKLWALRNVDFEARPADVVGVIGRNGAGKTTLLKVLSRITVPTEGRAEVRGRVASLLEVGTGFHPDLTGRENVYLNGVILGMPRAEVSKKFDEIIDFASVHRFVDTPVKRYSSGMYLRLAFSVAAHLDPDVLLVDEVLAVGDASFQRKCVGRMDAVARRGRTVFFVSHNMEAIQRLCTRCLWIENGGVKADGPTAEVVRDYLAHWDTDLRPSFTAEPAESGGPTVLTGAEIRDSEGRATGRLELGEPFAVDLECLNREAISGATMSVRLYDAQERLISAANTRAADLNVDGLGTHRIRCRFLQNPLRPGSYHVAVGCFVPPKETLFLRERVVGFDVVPAPHDGTMPAIHGGSLVVLPTKWGSAS